MKYLFVILTIMANLLLNMANAITLTTDARLGKCLGAIMLVQGVGVELSQPIKKIRSDGLSRYSPIYQKVNSCTSGSASFSLIKSCAYKLVSKNDAEFFLEFVYHLDGMESYVTKDTSSSHLMANCGEFIKIQ